MSDLPRIRSECNRLHARLAANPGRAELRAVYLELATVVSQLQGAVGDALRRGLEQGPVAQAFLEEVKASMRQVGLDIRLASDSSLLMGLQTSVERAFATIDALRGDE